MTAPLAVSSDDRFDLSLPSSAAPRLPCSTLLDVLQRADIAQPRPSSDRGVMVDAMKAAVEQRTDGVLSEKRRRHYGHTALLVGCVLELDPASAAWAEALRARTARWPAFQSALRDAMDRAARRTGGRSLTRSARLVY